MSDTTKKRRPSNAISVKGATYDRLQAFAKERGLTVAEIVDALVNGELDKLAAAAKK